MLFIAVVLILCSCFLYTNRKRHMSTFKRLGIPGPKPNFLFGSAIDIAKKGSFRVFPKLTKKYGSLVGFYIGGRPQILTTDLNLIRHVMIKDFHIFSDRNLLIPGGVHPQPQMQNTMAWAEVKIWRKLRSKMTPSFSISKLSGMEQLMISSIENMLEKVDEIAKCDKELNMEPLSAELSFSIATKCIFGVDLSLNHMTHEIQSLLEMARPRLEKSILAMVMMLFPSLTFIAYPLRVLWETIRFKMLWCPESIGYDLVRKIHSVRKDAKTKSKDLLQSLIDFDRVESTDKYNVKSSPFLHNTPQSTYDDEPLTEVEICANLNIMLLAAFETTSVTLQFIMHNLVNNQDIQQKLRNELKKAVENNGGKFNSKILSEVPLVSHVIKETLRMFPPASMAMSRRALDNYEYQGYKIPKGTGVFVDVFSIHNNPQFWPEPNEFRPERFEKDYDKFTYLPFGVGSRNCIGLRFAYMELELTLASLVVNYSFEPGPSTETNIELSESALALTPKKGVFCKATRVGYFTIT